MFLNLNFPNPYSAHNRPDPDEHLAKSENIVNKSLPRKGEQLHSLDDNCFLHTFPSGRKNNSNTAYFCWVDRTMPVVDVRLPIGLGTFNLTFERIEEVRDPSF